MAGNPLNPPPSLPPNVAYVPQQILDDYIKKIKLPTIQCMLCGLIGQYHVNPIIYEIRPFFQGGIAIGGNIPTVPGILIHCKKCGNTQFISTIITQMTPKIMIQAHSTTDDKDPLNGR